MGGNALQRLKGSWNMFRNRTLLPNENHHICVGDTSRLHKK